MSQHSKHTGKIVIFVVLWLALLGGAIALALLTKPEPEITHVNPIVEAYKFSEKDASSTVSTYDDLDYYSTYQPNPITFTEKHDVKTRKCKTISGLNNEVAEKRINNRILDACEELYNLNPGNEWTNTNVKITANYFNILSMTISRWIPQDPYYNKTVYLTFDLNTGEEIKFDDLFVKGIDLVPLLYESFYREAVSNYDGVVKTNGDIEREVYDKVNQYLAGEKQFYLNTYGPTFVINPVESITMYLKDNIRYAAYLKNYLTDEKIYKREPDKDTNLYFTQSIQNDNTFIYNEETSDYLFDYTFTGSYYGGSITQNLLKNFRETAKKKGLEAIKDKSKFYHIQVSASVGKQYDYRSGLITYCVYGVDKSYYNSIYRKAVIDNKLSPTVLNEGAPIGFNRLDTSKLEKPLGSNGCAHFNFAVTNKCEIETDVTKVVQNIDRYEWRILIIGKGYENACANDKTLCFTEEQQQKHKKIFTFGDYDGHSTSLDFSIKDEKTGKTILIWKFSLSDVGRYFYPISQEFALY